MKRKQILARIRNVKRYMKMLDNFMILFHIIQQLQQAQKNFMHLKSYMKLFSLQKRQKKNSK